jgi:hypothetical protein
MDNHSDNFTTDEQVPRSGLYRVSHAKHAIRDIKLLRRGSFPACPKCKLPVQFSLIEAIPIESASQRFRFLMQHSVPIR